MSHRTFAHALSAHAPSRFASRQDERDADDYLPARRANFDAGMAMRLQQTMGNAFVGRTLQATAPVALAPSSDDDEEYYTTDASTSAATDYATEPSGDGGGIRPAVEEQSAGQAAFGSVESSGGESISGVTAEENSHSDGEQVNGSAGEMPDDGAAQSQEDGGGVIDELLEIVESFIPDQEGEEQAVSVESGPGGFVDDGPTGVEPFNGGCSADPEGRARAFVAGGSTGVIPYAGAGGVALGPHNHEAVGTTQEPTVLPVYQSKSNGILSDSNAWVKDGTGDLTVRRSWTTSKAGDQGNGHFLTQKAASRLDEHESFHVAATKQKYDDTIAPMLERVKNSATLGKNAAFTQKGAIEKLAGAIMWESSIKSFAAGDKAENGPGGNVDKNDIRAEDYPETSIDEHEIGGKTYQHVTKVPSEAYPT